MNKIVKAGFALGTVAAIGAGVAYLCRKHHDEIDDAMTRMKENGKRELKLVGQDIKDGMDYLYKNGYLDVDDPEDANKDKEPTNECDADENEFVNDKENPVEEVDNKANDSEEDHKEVEKTAEDAVETTE